MTNEKRLIDVEQAKRATYEEVFWSESEQAVVRHFLAKLPKVDAVKVVHGRWEDGICTMCGYPIPTDSKYDFIDNDDCLFCYHCGAKMKGENEDG